MRTRRLFGVLMAGLLAGVGCTSPPAPMPDASMDAEPMDTAQPRPDTGVCEDLDNDGHPSAACGGDDCDDNNPRRNPGVREVCDSNGVDEDCDPCTVSGGAADGDQDADGYERATCTNPWQGMSAPTGCNARLNVDAMTRTVRGTDCNDVPAMMGAQQSPGLPEVCNNMVDDNCDGTVDEAVMGTLYRDVDNDGRGDRSGAAGTTMAANVCAMMPGWVANNDDCDDTRQETYRGARELCDRRDNDCSLPGAMAGGVDVAEDNDDDGYAPLSAMCLGFGEAGAPPFAFAKTDCNDMAATVRPNAMEICGNGIDEDCDRVVDNPTQRVCDDRDGDGHGDPSTMRTVMSCMVPAGTVTVCDDCDDSVATGARRFPGNREVCDRVDNDCSTPGTAIAVDEDTDNDGFSPSAATCVGRGEAGAPATAFPRTDCDDAVPTTFPGAPESCDRVDANCSSGGGVAAEEDADMDGYAATAALCLARGEAGATSGALPRGDCDEMRATVNPGVTENLDVCDGIDNDCNVLTSELGRPCAGFGACVSGGACARGLSPAEVVVGGQHACVRRNNGTVACWGNNVSGERGDGTTGNSVSGLSNPSEVVGLSDVVKISAGYAYTCAVHGTGGVSCWGSNTSGQLGDGSVNRAPTPVAAAGIRDAISVGTGDRYSCALRAVGSVQCWGDNSRGQLGDGTTNSRAVPGAVLGLSDVIELSVGFDHACARRRDGAVFCWGQNTSGQLGDGTTMMSATPVRVVGLSNVSQISAFGAHSCAVRADGSVWCWGRNSEGQLGDGTTVSRGMPAPVPTLVGATHVALGSQSNRTCARRSDGSVACWGDNRFGLIGDGTMMNRLAPVDLTGVLSVVQLAVGSWSSCALHANATVSCWGDNRWGIVGDGTTVSRLTPTRARVLPQVAELATTIGARSCARLDNGQIACWGQYNDQFFGQRPLVPQTLPRLVPNLDDSIASVFSGPLGSFARLNDGSLVRWGRLGSSTASRPIAASPDSNMVEVASSVAHACARLTDGTARCWGVNSSGQLGDGTTTDSSGVAVVGLSAVSSIATGQAFSCAVAAGGRVMCWGRNTDGQLGNGTTIDSSVPVVVSGITAAVEVVAGTAHACARTSGGGIYCWGNNATGQLGLNDNVSRSTATRVVGASGSTLSAGANVTCCASESNVLCWGQNSNGQIGDGTTIQRNTPTVVSGISRADEIAVGGSHVCARRSDQTVRCWGDNRYGQLGDGTTMSQSTPVVVPGLAQVTDISAGVGFTCARRSNGSVSCWGWNVYGQVGDGSTTNRTSPTMLRGVTDVRQLALSSGQSCGVRSDGELVCWDVSSFVPVGSSQYGDIVDLALGKVNVDHSSNHRCAAVRGGTARCWGSNTFGQLGNGTTTSGDVMVSGLSSVEEVVVGVSFSCARLTDRTVRCWGRNNSRQLGDGTSTDRSVPVTAGIADVVEIDANNFGVCARRGDGSVHCWGNGALSITAVAGVSDALQISSGTAHHCARRVDGTVLCWGDNRQGQLGNGTVTSSATPVVVRGLARVVEIAAGGDQTCARRDDGAALCWGANSSGQLGDGTTTSRTTPVFLPL